MPGGDSFGCSGLFQCLCGLVEAFLDPRSRSGRFPATNPRYPSYPSSTSSQVWRTGSPRDAGISSGPPPPVPRATSSSYSSSQVWSTGSPRDVRINAGPRPRPPVPPVARNLPPQQSDDPRPQVPRARISPPQQPVGPRPPVPPVARNLPPQQSDDPRPQVPRARISPPQQPVGPRPPVPPVARNPPPQQSDDDDDDDCVIVGQKGEVACRDFPHSCHLCSNMPFGTASHEKHCPMCYCFVCDAPAPCSYWGRGLSVDDHCHATDKETKWKTLREVFKQRPNGSGTSNGHIAQTSRPAASAVSAARAHSSAGAGRGTTNGHTAQISRSLAPAVSAPGAQPVAGGGGGTSNTHTAVSGPRPSSATRVQSGTSNGHSAQVTRLVEPTVIAPRPHPAAGAGRGTSNAHTALVTHPVEPSVSAARPYSAANTVTGTSNGHSAQVTRPVEQTISASRVYPAARGRSDSSNAHSAQITSPATANGEPHAPEGATVYVGNLPNHIDHERLKLSFQQAGVVLLSKVINDRETGQSRGFGFVTMNTVQEAEAAVRMYNGSVVYGRPLAVRIAAPRGSPRVDTVVLRQSGSPLRIYVCNLAPQVDRPRLEELFSKHGKVVDARVIYERREGEWCSKGFGFVTMATEEESRSAIRALNKQTLEGRALVVKVATERPERGSPSHSNQASLQNAVGQNQNTHTSVRVSPNVATVGASRANPASRARSGTSNASTAQVTQRLDPTRSN